MGYKTISDVPAKRLPPHTITMHDNSESEVAIARAKNTMIFQKWEKLAPGAILPHICYGGIVGHNNCDKTSFARVRGGREGNKKKSSHDARRPSSSSSASAAMSSSSFTVPPSPFDLDCPVDLPSRHRRDGGGRGWRRRPGRPKIAAVIDDDEDGPAFDRR